MPWSRAVAIGLVCAALGALLGRGDLLAQPAAIVVASLASTALLVSVAVEMLRGGHGPILRALLGELIEEIRLLRAQVTELEIAIGAMKTSANAALRRSEPGAADRSGSLPAIESPTSRR